jgi:Kef-type K+ transport system membrane component KefB
MQVILQKEEMGAKSLLFRFLTFMFVAALLGGLVAWRLRLASILGFALSGLAIDP